MRHDNELHQAVTADLDKASRRRAIRDWAVFAAIWFAIFWGFALILPEISA